MDVGRSREQRGDRLRRTAGWSLAVVTMLLFASVPLSLSGGVLARPGVNGDPGDAELWLGWLIAAYVISGVTLVQLRPRNWIGWLLVISGLLQTSNRPLDAYAARALTDPDSSLPLGAAGGLGRVVDVAALAAAAGSGPARRSTRRVGRRAGSGSGTSARAPDRDRAGDAGDRYRPRWRRRHRARDRAAVGRAGVVVWVAGRRRPRRC